VEVGFLIPLAQENAMKSRTRSSPAFTLIELLVVIAIIGVLIGMLLPAVQKVRAAAARMQCSNNLKQMALACYSYESTKGSFPAGIDWWVNGPGGPYSTWMWTILPFVEQQNLQNVNDNVGTIPLYYCPSDPRAYASWFYLNAATDYVAIEGLDYWDGLGIINSGGPNNYPNPPVRVTDVTDGTSNTIMLGERPAAADWSFSCATSASCCDNLSGAAIIGVNTGGPLNISNQQGQQCPAPPRYFGGGPFNVNDLCSYDQIWSLHTGGANFAMGDGSVRFISNGGNAIIVKCLATRAGGEVASVP
jgi:prepilin-type N-terminal cleavage/methylation domain-containing protein/prepilin-type processing-associated H-X9-DG protein